MTREIAFKSNNLVFYDITSNRVMKKGNGLIITIQILDSHAGILREAIFPATYKETPKLTLWEATPIQASYDST